MKLPILLILFLITVLASGQGYTFNPNWEKGDKRTVTSTTTTNYYLNDVSMGERTDSATFTVDVSKESKKSYTIKMTFNNLPLIKLHEKSDTDIKKLDQHKKTTLTYSINKKNSLKTLTNWEEIQSNYLSLINILKKIQENEGSNIDHRYEMAISELEDISKSQEYFEKYIQNSYADIFILNDKKLELNVKQLVNDTLLDQFIHVDYVVATKAFVLESVDKENKIGTINMEITMDLAEYNDVKSKLYLKNTPKGKRPVNAPLFNLDLTQNQLITYDFNTSWITQIILSGKLTQISAKGKQHQSVVKVVTID